MILVSQLARISQTLTCRSPGRPLEGGNISSVHKEGMKEPSEVKLAGMTPGLHRRRRRCRAETTQCQKMLLHSSLVHGGRRRAADSGFDGAAAASPPAPTRLASPAPEPNVRRPRELKRIAAVQAGVTRTGLQKSEQLKLSF